MQRNWIGRSEGTKIRFAVKGQSLELTVFTTRADTLWGVTFLAFAPEHPALAQLVPETYRAVVDEYLRCSRNRTELERLTHTSEVTEVFTGAYAIHPLTGDEVPIWAADYVLYHYGTGVLMGVPDTAPGGAGPGEPDHHLPPARLADFPSALLGHAYPNHPLLQLCLYCR